MNNLEDKLKATIMATAITEDRRRAPATLKWLIPCVATAALASVLVLTDTPKDTFDSPELAYAELERTFGYISQKIDMGAEIASKGEAQIETINNIFE